MKVTEIPPRPVKLSYTVELDHDEAVIMGLLSWFHENQPKGHNTFYRQLPVSIQKEVQDARLHGDNFLDCLKWLKGMPV